MPAFPLRLAFSAGHFIAVTRAGAHRGDGSYRIAISPAAQLMLSAGAANRSSGFALSGVPVVGLTARGGSVRLLPRPVRRSGHRGGSSAGPPGCFGHGQVRERRRCPRPAARASHRPDQNRLARAGSCSRAARAHRHPGIEGRLPGGTESKGAEDVGSGGVALVPAGGRRGQGDARARYRRRAGDRRRASEGVGASNRVALCDLRVFVDQATEAVAAQNANTCHVVST
jgi:hypothetical protein